MQPQPKPQPAEKPLLKQPDDEHSCPICMQILCTPQKIHKCNHIFCSQCIETLFELDDKAKCPMCRNFIKKDRLTQVKDLEEKIAEAHPEQYKTRKAAYVEWTKQQPIAFIMGNTAHKIKGDNYTWNLFFRAADKKDQDYIQKIEIVLHPTFTPSTVVIQEPPFHIMRIGWGVFNIRFIVHWKQIFGKEVQQINYNLSFAPSTETKITKRIVKS